MELHLSGYRGSAFAYFFTDRLKGHSFGKALLDFDSVVERHVFVFHCLSLHFSD